MNDALNLYFGIKAGFNSYDVNTNGLVSYGIGEDASLMNLDGGFSPNVGVGAHLKHENYFVSFSGGYIIKLPGEIALKPMVLVRYVDASPLSIDLTAIFTLSNIFDIGAAYRLDEGISGLFIFKVSPNFQIGYAYESSFEDSVRNLDNGTHEVMMNFKL